MYECIFCSYKTKIKTHYNKHLTTAKHQNNIQDISKNSIYDTNSQAYDTNMTQSVTSSTSTYFCCFCHAPFKSKSSKYRHQSKFCKKNEKLNVNKLVELLNVKEAQLNAKDVKINEHNDKIKELETKINELMETVQATYVNNGTIVQGNQQNIANIQLLNYNKTDYDFLSDSDYIRCFMDNNHCVKKLIEKVHFNPNKPENMNVYISSMKGKYVMVYRDNVWQLKNRKQQIDDLYETNELVLEQWFDEYKEQYPDIIKSFTRYLKNKSNDHELIRSVKDEVMLMLYNKRYLISD